MGLVGGKVEGEGSLSCLSSMLGQQESYISKVEGKHW